MENRKPIYPIIITAILYVVVIATSFIEFEDLNWLLGYNIAVPFIILPLYSIVMSLILSLKKSSDWFIFLLMNFYGVVSYSLIHGEDLVGVIIGPAIIVTILFGIIGRLIRCFK